MANYTIKVPVIITAPLDNPQRTYNNMVQQVTDTITNYNNSPIDQRVIVLYRKKLKRKTIKSIELINNTLPDGTPVILMRVEEYKTGHNDVYLQRQAAREASVDSADQLGSKKNYALLYPLIIFKNDGTVISLGNNKNGECNVENWNDIVMVSAALNHSVGLKSDGTVVAVGDNSNGQCDVSSWKDDVYDNEIVKLQDVLIDIIISQNYNDDVRKGIAGKDDQVPNE